MESYKCENEKLLTSIHQKVTAYVLKQVDEQINKLDSFNINNQHLKSNELKTQNDIFTQTYEGFTHCSRSDDLEEQCATPSQTCGGKIGLDFKTNEADHVFPQSKPKLQSDQVVNLQPMNGISVPQPYIVAHPPVHMLPSVIGHPAQFRHIPVQNRPVNQIYTQKPSLVNNTTNSRTPWSRAGKTKQKHDLAKSQINTETANFDIKGNRSDFKASKPDRENLCSESQNKSSESKDVILIEEDTKVNVVDPKECSDSFLEERLEIIDLK